MFKHFFSWFPIQKYKVIGHSMEPTLRPGDTVLASNIVYWFSKPTVGDIIVFKYKNKKLLKRIKRVRKSLVNVCGDNQFDSLDSRKLGQILKKDIIGKVIRW